MNYRFFVILLMYILSWHTGILMCEVTYWNIRSATDRWISGQVIAHRRSFFQIESRMTRSKRESTSCRRKIITYRFSQGLRRGAGAAIKRLTAVICFRDDLDGVSCASCFYSHSFLSRGEPSSTVCLKKVELTEGEAHRPRGHYCSCLDARCARYNV